MRRVVSVLIASLFLLVAVATPAAAAQTPLDERRVREDIPLGSFDFTLAAGEACDFPVLIEDISGRITFVFITEDRHGNILERLIFHTVARYTNVDTGASFDRRYDSVGNYVTRPDGSVSVVARNDVLYIGGEPPNALGPGLYLVDGGRVVEVYGADGSIISSIIESGEIIDVCALLS